MLHLSSEDIVSPSAQDIYNVAPRKGTRSIISRVGYAETGLLNNFVLMLRGFKSNKTSDCHTEINFDVLSSWNGSSVFPEIKKTNQNSTVVLDWATYHAYLAEEEMRPKQ